MRYIRFVLALLPLVAVACMAENTEPAAPAMVQPGTATRELGPMQFGDSLSRLGGDSPDGSRSSITPCYMAMNAGSVAVLEFQGEPVVVEAGESCDGPYASLYRVYPVRTLGVAAGAALPAEFDLVVLPTWLVGGAKYDPQPGDVWLITAREAEEQQFLATWTPVGFDGGETVQVKAGGFYPPVDFPATFEGLVDTLTPLVADLAAQCPEEAAERRSDERWRDLHFDPATHNCHPDDPSDFESPEGEQQ